MGLTYLDSVFCIYAIEDAGEKGIRARQLLSSEMTFTTSPLVRMECLIMPLRLAQLDVEEDYRRFFTNLRFVSIPDEAYERAARLRAVHHSLRTPDALHLATAQLAGCSHLWTGDEHFAKLGGPFVRNIFTDGS